MKRKTLTQYLVEQQRSSQALSAEVRLLIEIVSRACKTISHAVSNGALGQLPLGLLPTAPATVSGPLSNYAAYKSVPWLIKDAAITQLPSANALVTLRSLPAGNANRKAFVGFGDPDFTVP